MIKRIVGDLLSLIFGNNEEEYEPSKGEYGFFVIVILMIVVYVTFESI